MKVQVGVCGGVEAGAEVGCDSGVGFGVEIQPINLDHDNLSR